SIATAFMRLPSESPASSGIAKVSTVATAAMAAKSIARTRVLVRFSAIRLSMAVSEIEVDHLAHHQHADRHPDRAAGQHRPAHWMGPQQFDVCRAGGIDEEHHR